MEKPVKVLAITLARGGSKTIKNKNIVQINKYPLIFYTIKEAKKSKYITDYIVSTDSKIIKKVCEKYNVEVPFLRPKNLATDKASSASALKHAVLFMEKKNKIKYDYIIELMCTNPLKDVSDIDAIIDKIIKTKADSVIAVNRLYDHHPSRIKKIVKDKIKDFYKEKNESRRQDLVPYAYIRSGAIYCMSRDYLIKKGKRYGGNNSRPFILQDDKAFNLDEPKDLEYIKIALKNYA